MQSDQNKAGNCKDEASPDTCVAHPLVLQQQLQESGPATAAPLPSDAETTFFSTQELIAQLSI